MLLAIKEEVIEYRENYQGVFRKYVCAYKQVLQPFYDLSQLHSYFNISSFAKVEFYRLLCADACSLCGRAVHNSVSTSLPLVYVHVCMCKQECKDMHTPSSVCLCFSFRPLPFIFITMYTYLDLSSETEPGVAWPSVQAQRQRHGMG